MFCQNCGSQAVESARFCAGCGRALVIASVPPADSRVAKHVRLLAILWMARAGLTAVTGFWVLFVGTRLMPWIFDAGRLPNGPSGVPFPGFVSSLISATAWMILIAAGASLAVGIGLYNHDAWARPLALVMGFLSLLSPVLGTALGIYTLWVLLPARADQEYQRLARAA